MTNTPDKSLVRISTESVVYLNWSVSHSLCSAVALGRPRVFPAEGLHKCGGRQQRAVSYCLCLHVTEKKSETSKSEQKQIFFFFAQVVALQNKSSQILDAVSESTTITSLRVSNRIE